MLIFGIETSCDETAASVIEIKNHNIKVLSNIVSSQIKLHAPYGGVVPSLAAREHVKNLPKVLRLALGKHSLKNIDLIAVTRGPGLISSLLVGTIFAKTLAWKYNKPIIGVNHLEGHIASNWLTPVGYSNQLSAISDQLPAMCLIVSGGHTELVLMTSINKHKLIGQTLDDAAGEAFDKIARILNLGYPGGPAISAEAERSAIGNELIEISKNQKSKLSTANYPGPTAGAVSGLGQLTIIKLPRPMLHSKDFNFSFAGLKTAVLYLVRDLIKSNPLSKIKTAIAVEAQRAIVDVLVFKTIRAAQKYKVKSIMLSGGVSANRLLRSELEKEANKKGTDFLKPEMEYTTDNATMIALAGYLSYSADKKRTDWKSVKVSANLAL